MAKIVFGYGTQKVSFVYVKCHRCEWNNLAPFVTKKKNNLASLCYFITESLICYRHTRCVF